MGVSRCERGTEFNERCNRAEESGQEKGGMERKTRGGSKRRERGGVCRGTALHENEATRRQHLLHEPVDQVTEVCSVTFYLPLLCPPFSPPLISPRPATSKAPLLVYPLLSFCLSLCVTPFLFIPGFCPSFICVFSNETHHCAAAIWKGI